MTMHATAGVSREAGAEDKRTLSTRVCGGYCLAVGAALQRMPLTGRTSVVCGRAAVCACVGARCLFARACACLRRAMFELLRRQQLDLLGAFYADNVNDGMRGNVRAHLLLAAPRPCDVVRLHREPRARGRRVDWRVDGSAVADDPAAPVPKPPSPLGAPHGGLARLRLGACHAMPTDAVVRRNGPPEQPARWRQQVLPN